MEAKPSIIIPSLGRTKELDECLQSISDQPYRPYEVVIVKDEGPLAWCRNKGARLASGNILIFIDDDVVVSKTWLQTISEVLGSRDDLAGLSGPSVITSDYRNNRDVFKDTLIKRLHDKIFLGELMDLPGHITDSGAWTTGASREDCSYEGSVEFLEACNMSFKREAFQQVGGFDESYKGIGDWSEPDLCFRLRQRGKRLWFTRNALLYHRPSKTGAYKKRLKRCSRMENYLLFSSRWVKPSMRHSAYKLFMATYYWMKENRLA